MTAPLRLVVTGSEGQLGSELVRFLAPLGQVIPLARQDLDVSVLPDIERVLAELRPAVIFNAAAFTAVDRAESEPDLAMRVNGEAPAVIGAVAGAVGSAVVHFSTDFVFDGQADRPYREEDPPNPINVYGKTKLAGEEALVASGASHMIVRTSWLWGMRRPGFVQLILEQARSEETLRVVDDQCGSPTWVPWFAETVAGVVRQLLRADDGVELAFRRAGGVVHLTAAGSASRYAFAKAILACDGSAANRQARRLEAIRSVDYPTPAARPNRAVLDCTLVDERFGLTRPLWSDQLRAALV